MYLDIYIQRTNDMFTVQDNKAKKVAKGYAMPS